MSGIKDESKKKTVKNVIVNKMVAFDEIGKIKAFALDLTLSHYKFLQNSS
jgi:hypothetical protein